jgi:ATP-dependent RNA helicase DDX55/SPB4
MLVLLFSGRLEDTLFRVKEFNTRKLEVLVLDEADRLLDMGFEKSLNKILSRLPKQRRTGLFSATQTSQVEALMRAGLRNPAIISVKVEDKQGQASTQATPTSLRNYFAMVEPDTKLAHLVRYLAQHPDRKIIVFVLTCAMVDYFGKILPEIPQLAERSASGGIHALHGQMVQKKRTAIYDEFVQSQNGVLIATDLIARGVDIPDVDCIIQFDPPQVRFVSFSVNSPFPFSENHLFVCSLTESRLLCSSRWSHCSRGSSRRGHRVSHAQ